MSAEVFEDQIGPNESEALSVVRDGEGLVVRDQASLEMAEGLLIRIKDLRRRFDEEFDPGIKQAFMTHKTLVAQKKRWTDPLDQRERDLKPRIAAYLVEEDRKRLEAERARFQAERKIRIESDAAADKVHELVGEGRLDEADQVQAEAAKKVEAIQAATPAVPEKPLAPAVVLKETWDFEVEDLAAVPREFLVLDEKKVRAIVRAMKDQTSIPGIKAFAVKSVAAKGERS